MEPNPYLSEAITQIGGGDMSLGTPMQDFPPVPQFGGMVGGAPSTNIPVQLDLDPIDPLEILNSKLEAKINRGRNTQAAARAVTDIRGTKPIMENQKILADRAEAIELEMRRLQAQMAPPPMAQPMQITDRQMLFAVLGELLTGGSGHALQATVGQSKERQEREFANAMRQYGFDQAQIQQGLDRYRARLQQVEGQSDQVEMLGLQDQINDENRAADFTDRVNLFEMGAKRDDQKIKEDREFTLGRDKTAQDLQRESWNRADKKEEADRDDARRKETVTTYKVFLDQAKETLGSKGFTPEIVAMLKGQRKILADRAGISEEEVGYLPTQGDTLETLEFGLRRSALFENMRQNKAAEGLDRERLQIDRDRLSKMDVKPDEAEKDAQEYVVKVWTPGRGKVLGAQAAVEQARKQLQALGPAHDREVEKTTGLNKKQWMEKKAKLESDLAKAEQDQAAARAEFGPVDEVKRLYTDRTKQVTARQSYPEAQMSVAIEAKRGGHSVEKIRQAAAAKGFILTEDQIRRLTNAK